MTKKKTPIDYKFLKLLGEGSFSSVYLAVDSATTSQANLITASQQQQHDGLLFQGTKQQGSAETKTLLATARKYAIKDSERLYFVMTYAENGDLLTYMLEYPLSLNLARKYMLQLVEALEHLHKLDLIHRDLKPENILLDDDMNIMISDFGSAQIYIVNDESDSRTTIQDRRNSFVGTAQYVSPEMLKNRQASNMSDIWALGVILYQMITNIMPFNAPNEYLIYQKIHNLEFEFPEDFDACARDLVSSLIKLEPLKRLGAQDDFKNNGYISIREHEFLKQQEQDQASTCVTDTIRIARKPDECFTNIDKIKPGFDEAQFLRLLTLG